MEALVRKFRSFKEAEEADREFYEGLNPQERITIMLDLIYPEGSDAASARFERVYRIIKLGKS